MNQARWIASSGTLFLATIAGQAHAQLRVAAWNISNYTGGRTSEIQTVTYGVNAANGITMRPDILLLQEISSQAALNAMVTALNTAPGSPGDWAGATYTNGPDLDNAVAYRTSKLTFLGRVQLLSGGASPAVPRDVHRYNFRPVGYSSANAMIAMYPSHMKAQDSGSDDDNRRLLEAQAIRTDAQNLPAGWHFIYGGDTNIQSSTSTEYQALVGSQANNNGRFFDPINRPGTWNNNASFAVLHTQDPSGSGGMDDRHDQILIGANLFDGTGIDYVGNPAIAYNLSTWNDPNHSYRAWGNDGTSMNLTMTTTGNTFVGPAIAQAVIDCAVNGGHIPVIADFKMPAKISTNTININFGTVAQNSVATQNITVNNAGNTALWTVNGLQSLNYSFAASSGFTAPAGNFSRTPGSAGAVHPISMNTSTLGTKNGTVTITSSDPDVPSLIINLTGQVGAGNTAPVANAGPDQTIVDTDGNGVETVTLDGSLSTDDNGIINYRWNEGITVISQGPGATQNVVLSVGAHIITLTVSDSALLTSTDQVVITIESPSCPADLDDGSGTGSPDGGIDINDLLYFLSAFEQGSGSADLDDGSGTGSPDGGVDINDLLFFLSHFEEGC